VKGLSVARPSWNAPRAIGRTGPRLSGLAAVTGSMIRCAAELMPRVRP